MYDFGEWKVQLCCAKQQNNTLQATRDWDPASMQCNMAGIKNEHAVKEKELASYLSQEAGLGSNGDLAMVKNCHRLDLH